MTVDFAEGSLAVVDDGNVVASFGQRGEQMTREPTFIFNHEHAHGDSVASSTAANKRRAVVLCTTDVRGKIAGVRRLFPLLVLACLVFAGNVAMADATVEGRVELPHAKFAPVATKRYEVVSKSGVLSTDPPQAVVYVEGAFPRETAPRPQQVAQKNLAFAPALLAIQAGTRVEFPNLDDTYHNIFSYSPAKRFDLGRYRRDEQPVPAVTFDKSGLVTLRCDIHEHMRGLILVLDSPYFTTTDADGRFRLAGLPTGRLKLKAWIDSRTTREKDIDLANGGHLHVDLP